MRSSPVEEKKSDSGEKEETNCLPPDKTLSSVPLGNLSNSREKQDSRSPRIDEETEDKKVRPGKERGTDNAGAKDDDMYDYDGTADDDDPAAENNSVDDIQMSPIPFDREDPTTLMELPENLMMIPISPCGPKDA
jgi:hypothetical protein